MKMMFSLWYDYAVFNIPALNAFLIFHLIDFRWNQLIVIAHIKKNLILDH